MQDLPVISYLFVH